MAVNQVKRNGSYAPLSAYYYDDDAIIRAGERAEVLFCRLLAFSARALADGYVSDAQMSRVGAGLAGLKPRLAKLGEVGLLERCEGDLFGGEAGYRLVQWLKWNLSAEEISHRQRKDTARKVDKKP